MKKSQAMEKLFSNPFATNILISYFIFKDWNKATTTIFKEERSLFFYLSKSLESCYFSVGVRSFFKELQVDVGLINVEITQQSA